MSTPIHQPRCGQFTFYFPKCGHATSHKYHRALTNGPTCNSNCIYDQKIDYWFWAGTDKRCSFCGLGQDHGFGAPHPIPESPEQRLILFERVKEGMNLGDPDEVYNSNFDKAVRWYNRKAIEEIELADERSKAAPEPSQGKLRTQRRLRHQNRWEVRRLRAKRRTERWVQNVRDEQYQAVKANIDVGKQPFIIGELGDPYMDIYSEVPIDSLPLPVDNCSWCQYPLSDVGECGHPYSLPCKHMFHLYCITELFSRRIDAEEQEVCKCPLCNVWFRDLREIPDFYARYYACEHEFDSHASSSVLSESDAGDAKGDTPPPWIFQPELLGGVPEWLENRVGTRSNVRLRTIIQDSIESRSQTEMGVARDNSSSQPRRIQGTDQLLNHFSAFETSKSGDSGEEIVDGLHIPECCEPNSNISNPSSTETENGSLLEAVVSVGTLSSTDPVEVAGGGAKRRTRRPSDGSNCPPRKRPRQ